MCYIDNDIDYDDSELPIAEWNENIAMGFLKKAYDVSKEDEEYILNNNIKTE